MSLKQPFLFFTMQLDETSELNRGRLFLCDYEQGIIGRWVATSALGAKQGVKDWSVSGGVLPPTYELNNPLAFYAVATKPVDLRHVKGVEGNGYPITPFAVTTKDGIERSDLLIHKDANQPGSLGCVVLPESEFADFEKAFKQRCSQIESVKLLVGYTY
ncbi:MAG: hypothetical protein RM021_016340 [Nostoc sp. EkiNYC01]|nr:hypothetical protein [Nostoc sp. EkiNYC01]